MAEGSPQLSDDEHMNETNSNGNVCHPTPSEKHLKIESELGQLEEAGVILNITDSLSDTNNRKTKRELPNDFISSPNSTNKGKKYQRNYRARVMESSSEDESSASNSNINLKQTYLPQSSDTSKDETCKSGINNALSNRDEYESISGSTCVNISNVSNIGSANSDNTEGVEHNDNNSSSRNPTTGETTSDMDTNQASTQAEADRNEDTSPSSNRLGRLFSRFPMGNLENTDSDDSLNGDESDDNERRGQSNEDKAAQRTKIEENVTKQLNMIMSKRKPKHKWNSLISVINRPYGMPGNRQTSVLFMNRYYDSLHVAQRLELVSKLDFHSGCTNALNFNDSGELLASSSDDLQIAVWDWMREKTLTTYNSGHRNNVFQCKFLPLTQNTQIASCARDGQVRLADISSSGVCRDTRRLAKHSRSAHKLAVRLSTPYELMSAGEDAFVYNIDIRASQPDKIVLVKDIHGSRVPLYSIHQHPINDDQFCVSGQDEYVRVYDRRIISPLGPPVLKYCPSHLIDKKVKSNITCAVYSNNGDGILASYNDDDIYLFDTSLSEGAAPAHRYSGHRNSSTVKGVNFFSPSSRFVVSGSDCGNIFIWDRETEAIVNCMHGDENGVVNVLEPHPNLPILATSGLDNEIKVWVPTHSEEPKLTNLHKTVRTNIMRRLREGSDDCRGGLDTHLLMVLFQHLRRNPNSFRGRDQSSSSQAQHTLSQDYEDELGLLDSSDGSTSDGNDSDDDDDDDDDSEAPNRGDVVQCSMN